MDFVYIEDVARANLMALESEVTDEPFNVGTGVQTSLNQLCEMLLHLTGSPLKPVHREARRLGDAQARRACTTKAERMLGFRSQVDLENCLRKLIEKRFVDYVGARHAVAVSSCTTALHLAMIVSGIKEGDEVLCPSFSFIATANCIRYAGAQPVFVDIDPV